MKIIFLAILLAVIAFPAYAHDKEKSYERVMKTRTLKCSYASLSPFVIVDLKTDEVVGLFPEILKEIGNRLSLSIEWTEEANYPQIAAGLSSNRYDAFCGVLWATPARGAGMKFSAPLYYQSVNPCVSGKSTEYDKSTDPLNQLGKKMMGYDGDISGQITKSLFPKAEFVSIPDNVSFGEAMQWIATGKVDAVPTCDRIVAEDFNKNQAGAIKIAAPDKPITTVQVSLALPLGEQSLTDMVDLAIFAMQADGTMEKIISKYLGKDRLKDTIIIPKIGR